MDRKINEQIHKWKDGQMARKTSEQIDKWTKG